MIMPLLIHSATSQTHGITAAFQLHISTENSVFSLMMSNCDVVTFPLVSPVSCGA